MPALSGARLIAAIAGGVIILCLVGWLAWSLFIRPGQQREAVASAKADRTVAEGQVKAAQDSIRITERTHDITTRIETVQRDGVASVMAASNDAAASAAARRAVCGLPDLYRGQPACDSMLDAGAAKPESADAGLANPAR